MRNQIAISIFFILFFINNISAQKDSITKKTKFILIIPGLDMPANFKHNSLAFKQLSPSTNQSLALTSSLSQTQQYYTKRLFFNPSKKYSLTEKSIRYIGLCTTDLLAEYIIGYMPLGAGWLHEEWHRAVLNQNNVRSFDDINKFPIGQELVSVSHLTDEDLIRFKASNNPDFVRMGIAGAEAQSELVKSLQKDNFYYKTNVFSQVSYWINILNNIGYINICSTIEGDSMTIKAEQAEGTRIEVRDFTGLDFTGWIYDLSRPDEAYEQRGLSESGVGIRRYRRTTDLTTEELNYLKKMGKLNLVNLISPMMFMVNSIKINQDLRFNFSLFHNLTSFGYDVGSFFLVDYKNSFYYLGLHNYRNLENGFYGIEAQLIDKEQELSGIKFLISPGLHIWTQPENQEFRTSKMQAGGRAELNISTVLGKIWRPYITISAKTSGWVAGDISLEPDLSARFGLRVFI